MAQLIELKASARPRAGKGAARQARRDGHIPAVIYGDARPPEAINLDYNTLWKQALKGRFTSTVFEIDVDGKKQRVIPRDLQVCPVKDTPLHADFLRVGKDGIIRVAIPMKFINETLSHGLKRGGVLNIVRHNVEVFCPYDKIPAVFEVNLEGLDIGRSIHISAVTMPADVSSVIKDRDFTIATIAGQRKEEEVIAAGDAAAAATPGAAAPAAGGKAAPAAAAGGKAAAPAAGAKAPAAGAKAPAAGGKAAPAAAAAKPAAKPAAKK